MDEPEVKCLVARIAQCQRLARGMVDGDMRHRIEKYQSELNERLNRLQLLEARESPAPPADDASTTLTAPE